MRNFQIIKKVFVKSKNETYKIFRRYTLTLLLFILLLMGYYLINRNYNVIIDLIKAVLISSVINIIFQYFININRKKKDLKLIFLDDNVLASAFIISLFTYKESILIIILANIISGVARLLSRSINISSSLYGILFVLIYQQFYLKVNTPLINLAKLNYQGSYEELLLTFGSLKSYILGFNTYYLSPILSFLVFIYLFIKRSIKYPVVFAYFGVFFGLMLGYSIFSGMNIWFLIFQITTGNLLFLTVYALTDYRVTPVTQEGQYLYGIILGILTFVLRFIIPELAVVIPLILGHLLLTKYIDKISFKLKNNHKLYLVSIVSSLMLGIILLIVNLIIY